MHIPAYSSHHAVRLYVLYE